MKLNKYLKELGLTKKEYPFDKDRRNKPDKEGFAESEFFCLSYTLTLHIYSRLCYFREYCTVSYPSYVGSMEKWNEILDIMIEGFKTMILSDDDFHLTKEDRAKIDRGWKYFIRYYNGLWY